MCCFCRKYGAVWKSLPEIQPPRPHFSVNSPKKRSFEKKQTPWGEHF